eukprot:4159639-Ditylum_brightwellii.AAC.1
MGEIPLEIGSFVNHHSSHHSTEPLSHPLQYLQTVHVDISFGNSVAPDSIKYCFFLWIDRPAANGLMV